MLDLEKYMYRQNQYDVVRLDLSSLSLTEVPPEVFQLTELTALNLSDNELTEIPSEISCLTGLTSLNLTGNKLTEIPLGLKDTVCLTLDFPWITKEHLLVRISQLSRKIIFEDSPLELLEALVERDAPEGDEPDKDLLDRFLLDDDCSLPRRYISAFDTLYLLPGYTKKLTFSSDDKARVDLLQSYAKPDSEHTRYFAVVVQN